MLYLFLSLENVRKLGSRMKPGFEMPKYWNCILCSGKVVIQLNPLNLPTSQKHTTDFFKPTITVPNFNVSTLKTVLQKQ